MSTITWQVEVAFTEDEKGRRTELAAARALSDRAHKLLDDAAERIHGFPSAPA